MVSVAVNALPPLCRNIGRFERLPHTTREFTTPTSLYSGPTETIVQLVL